MTVLGAAFWGFDRASDSGTAQTLGGYGPAMMRFGVSFLGGFTLGWLLRRFLKWTLLIGGVLAIGIFVLRKTGAFDLPWQQIEENVDQGSSWLQEQAGTAKKLLSGYLPSGVAAIIGGFLGFRRR